MEKLEADNILLKNYDSIQKKVTNRILNQDKYGYLHKGNKQHHIDLYTEFMDYYLLNPDSKISLYAYKLPENNEYKTDIQVINDYLTGYYSNINPLLFLKEQKKYKNEIKYIPYSQATESQQYKFDNAEDDRFTSNLFDNGCQKLVEDIIERFSDELNSIDKQILISKIKEEENKSIELKTGLKISAINERYTEIQYRLLAFIIINNRLMYEDSYLLQAFNSKRFVKYNKKYLFTFILTSIPSKDELKNIVKKEKSKKYKDKNDKEEIKSNKVYKTYETGELFRILRSTYDPHLCYVQEKDNGIFDPNNHIFKSKKDFTGKIHEKYKVYINAQGWAYDHVTGGKMYLM